MEEQPGDEHPGQFSFEGDYALEKSKEVAG